MKGLIHCHSENSRYDSAMNVKTLCNRAKDLGYEAVTLTDHGTLTGIDDFVSAAREIGIKPIPGVEAYIQEDNSNYNRFHLIILAKDDIGYQGIGKAVSESNKRIDEHGFPRMNKEILNRFFGPGSKYHSHVIATSACAGGVLAGLFLSSSEFLKKIRKLRDKQSRYEAPGSASYETNKKLLKKKEKEVEGLVEKKDRYAALSKKPFKKKENDLERLKKTASEEEYQAAAKKLEEEKEESALAAKSLEIVRAKIALTKKEVTAIKEKIKEADANHERYQQYEEEIEKIKEKIIPIERLYSDVVDEAKEYDTIFGHGNFYVEIQYHGYLTDDKEQEVEKLVMPQLFKVARELSLPIVAANDAHIPDGSEESIRARQIICSLRYAKKGFIAEVHKGDDQIYVKSEDEMKEAMRAVLPTEEDVDEAVANAYRICDECNCEFKNGNHYPKFQGLKHGETADKALRKMAEAGIRTRFPDKKDWTEEYQKRMEYELSVISEMGYSDYFLIVQDFLEFGRKLGHLTDESLAYLRENIKSMTLKELIDYVESHQETIGFTIGAGRGSAAGSLIAYLIGITNIIDPLKYDLLFERFLNKDRVSMPDVDSDFSPDIRDLVVEYCKKLYGIQSVANIVTKGYIQPKGAIRNTARVLGIEKEQKDYYQVLADKIAKMVPSKPGTSFETCEDEIREAFKLLPEDDKEKEKYKADANEVIDQAKLVDGVFLNYGMHAAGVIIADGNPIDDYVPLMRDEKSGDMKVQCNMVQAEEEHGLLKFDFLGLRNLKIVTMTLRSIKERAGKEIDVEHLPFDPVVFKEIFATGKTGSVFQFESSGMKKMLRSFKPDCFEDLVALVSLYRPGPMDFIPQYIEAKFHPESIKYLCPELEEILGKTYGCIVYQEQVMEIVQKLAGFSLSQADNVRRFMSKKKMDKLEHEREAFINGDAKREIDGCIKRGISKEIANKLFDQMIEFAKYAFNKSHAAAYAILSYVTAYLKYYYPADYMCAVLNCTDDIKKMPSVLNDCREIGIKVATADINKSEIGFSIQDDQILFGLNSVKGTKAAYAAQIIHDRKENGEYVSFKDFLRRNVADKSTTENLIKAGAMDEFHTNRYAMLEAYTAGSELVSKINAKKKDIEEMDAVYEESKEKKRFMTSYKKAKDTLDMLNTQFNILRIIDCPEDGKQRMLNEKEVLGFFITAHPLDSYCQAEDRGCTAIADLENTENRVNIMGVIENLEIKRRKSDNKPMAFFDLEDKTGIIHVCCFTKAYAKYQEKLDKDEVVQISGFLNTETDEISGEEETQIYMDDMNVLNPDANAITIFIRDMLDWNKTLEKIREQGYIEEEGHPLLIHDKLNAEFRKARLYVSEDILEDNQFEARIYEEAS